MFSFDESSSFWLAVASAEHVRRGRAEGFMQVCHGKRGPLARVLPGSGIVYYSPTETFGGKTSSQSFTAIGRVRSGQPYAYDMGNGFVPFRQNVDWFNSAEAPIHPLLDKLDFTRGHSNWGYQLRFGLIKISEADFDRIGKEMIVSGMES